MVSLRVRGRAARIRRCPALSVSRAAARAAPSADDHVVGVAVVHVAGACGQFSRGPSPAWASRLAYAWNQHCVHCPLGGFVAFALAISARSLRVEGAGSPDQALPGVVGDQGGGLVSGQEASPSRSGSSLLGPARGDGEQLRDRRDRARRAGRCPR